MEAMSTSPLRLLREYPDEARALPECVLAQPLDLPKALPRVEAAVLPAPLHHRLGRRLADA